VDVGFEEGTAIKGFTTSGVETVTAYDISLSACDRLLRLRLKNSRARRNEMSSTIPPITPPMITSVGFLSMVVKELGEPEGLDELVPDELDELSDGTLVEVVEDGALFC
jgi:hypothetical protein